MMLLVLVVSPVSKLEQLVLVVVVHLMNHHLTQLALMPQDLVLVMKLLVLVVLVHMNHHHTVHQQVKHLVVQLVQPWPVLMFYPKVDSKLLDIRVR
jgi:hypothetical protein